jgi:hypothetical protein
MNDDLETRVADLERRLSRLTDHPTNQTGSLAGSLHVAILALCDLLARKGITNAQELADLFGTLSDEVFFYENSEAASSFLDQIAQHLRRASDGT